VSGDGESHAEFLADFAYLSSIGGLPSGGVDREAATIADAKQRTWLGGWLAARGFDVHVDEVGNQFGLMTFVEGAPYVLTGSHLDSQPTSGRFDGAYGVLASAHAANRVAKGVRSGAINAVFNLAVVNWFNEEGSRFPPSMMGSAVFTGKLSLDTALAVTDARGVSVRRALDEIGYRGDFDGLPVQSYAEIHIEQGKELEQTGHQIGIVTGTWGARKLAVTVRGEQSHTGSTLMADRKDALLGAAHLIAAARALCEEIDGVLHTAVSHLEVYPNSPVVVASEVRSNLDLRSPDPAVLEEAERRMRVTAVRIERDLNVRIDLAKTHSWDRNDYTPAGFALSERASADAGYSHREILTVAGHDSTNLKDLVPTVMLFVPSRDGVSHNEYEYTEDADLLAGLDVMGGVVRQMVSGALQSV